MIQKITLENGLRVLLEPMPYVRSCALGIWIHAGSRFETPSNNGVSHFLEHMFFKGTTSRTAQELAWQMDQIGGQSNAFTAKECTCFHAKCLTEHMPEAFDLLSDMYHHSLFRPEDIELERGIIKEEISMYEDSPEDLCIDTLHEGMWSHSSLALPILGTEHSLESLHQEELERYRSAHYTPQTTIISIAGKFDKQQLLELIQQHFGADVAAPNRKEGPRPLYTPGKLYRAKEIEQNHIALGFEGVDVKDDDVYSISVLANVLGGSMSSRLFQEVREKRGLAYSIYAFTTSYQDAGAFTIYAGLNPASQQEAVEVIRQQIDDVVTHGITEEEFLRGREQMKANLIMGHESVTGRMSAMARGEMFRGYLPTLDETIARMDALTMEDIHRTAHRVLQWERMSQCVVGDVEE